jgi:hypothetical protein
MSTYTPWFIAVVFAALIIISRLITNSHLIKSGHVPAWLSLLYLAGLIGMIMTAIWSSVTIGWWGAIPVILLYFALGLVKSEIQARTSAQKSHRGD